MANEFTKEQQKAIETVDKSVLVSAAAGSGKTSVLIERIIRIILEGKANVDDLLVVTFTDAAAAEMRQRLTYAIRKRMADHPEDASYMKDQLSRMYRAYISTIHSFALRVIKEFFHEIDMEPNFTVADDVQSQLMKLEALNEIFDAGFEDDDLIAGGSFREFLRLYSDVRDDDSFRENLLKAYDAIRTIPDYFEWAYKKAEILNVSPETFDDSELKKLILADGMETFSKVLDSLRGIRGLFDEVGISDKYEDIFSAREEAVFDIFMKLKAGSFDDEVIEAINTIPSKSLSVRNDAYKLIRTEAIALNDGLKKEIEGFQERYLVPDFETRLKETGATYEYTVYYLRLLEEFERRYEEKKREKRMIDFSDMEHIAARILKDDEAAETLRKRFKFIFVDEYQDTNNIQDHLINRIARPDNVFKVGDVKQSIYKFRQAEPENFERLYAYYSSGKDPDGIAIDLGYNFRSNDATITYINHVFRHIMEGYDARAMLYTGLTTIPKEYDPKPEVHILIEDTGNTDDAAEEALAGELDTGDFSDEKIEELTKDEAEAEYIAGIVSKMIGTDFYDSKKGVVRKVEARDIVILIRSTARRGELMSRALRDKGIEPHLEKSENYFDTVEIGVALSLLKCIDNMKRDVPLITVLHSEIFGFDPSELAQIRIAHSSQLQGKCKPAYWKAFEWFAEEGPDGSLREKTKNTKEKLLEWRMLSRMMPLEDFVWKVLVDSGYYRMAGAMSGGAGRQANLRSLADRAGAFSKDNVATLNSFLSFLENMKDKKMKSEQAAMAGSDDDVVRISTIHKSKGLEFPFVIVGFIGCRFEKEDVEKRLMFDSGTGLGLPFVDPERRFWRATLAQRLINDKINQGIYKEELRLLYVAMTRARNKLIMVGRCKNEEALEKIETKPSSYLGAMKPVLETDFNEYYTAPLMLTKTKADSSVPRSRTASYLDVALNEEEQAIYDEIDRRFRYRYPDEDLLTAKAKWSVSAIRKEELEEEKAKQREVVVMSGDEVTNIQMGVEKKKRASAADVGTAYHRFMEFLDFAKATKGSAPDMDYITERAEFLKDHNAIDDEVYASLDLSKIAAFFESDLGRRAIAASARGSLKREKPFTLKTVRGGNEMLVQGVIDCCFEEDGKMILIDYKSSYIRPGAAREAELERIKDEYKIQIELYSEAVEKGTGKEVSEAYLYLFTIAEAVRM